MNLIALVILIIVLAIILAYVFSHRVITATGGGVEPRSGAYAIISPTQVVENYAKNNGPQTMFQQGSISKSFTAMLVGILVEKGLLKWDDPADKHLTRWKIGDSNITIEHLLRHTSGLAKPPAGGSNGYSLDVIPPTVEAIANDEPRWVPVPKHIFKIPPENRKGLEIRNSAEMKVKPGLEFPLSAAVASVPMFSQTALKRLDEDNSIRVSKPPGKTWEYNNHNYLVIQMLIEDATDMTFADLCHKHILNPLGMTNSSFLFETIDKSNLPTPHWKDGDVPVGHLKYRCLAPGGLYSTLPDMVKFCQELINPTLVKPHTMKKLLSTTVSKDYAMGFMIESDGWVGHRGTNTGWKSHYIVNPSKKRGVVYMSNYQGHPYTDWLYGVAGIKGYFSS